ncbi:MAG: hypothetical protein PUP93_31000 [Rhizonema sp. NSF051]|nr:hypothetical protein [Rhizonema sp. NSF051]
METLLHHNVPRFIAHIKQRGGVSDSEWQWLQSPIDCPEFPEGIFARADEYLLYPKTKEKFQKGLFVLVKVLAILSFCPGGIKIFGMYFSPDIENYVELEP